MAASRSSVDTSDTFDKAKALQVLNAVASRRSQRLPLSLDELEQIHALLGHFDKSPSLKAAPSKSELHNAIASLLHPAAGPLSAKWTKNQLCCALRGWIEEAMVLQQESWQKTLFLEVKRCKHKPKHLAHEIFFEDDDGSVSVFSVSSPSPVKAKNKAVSNSPKTPKGLGRSAAKSPSGTPETETFTPLSIRSANDFAEEMRQIAEGMDETLANVSVCSPITPGVPATSGATEIASASATTEDERECLARTILHPFARLSPYL